MNLPDRMAQANELLAPYATPHEGRLGRIHDEPEDETRFPFQRDRARVIHSKAFRRLAGKTQVIVNGHQVDGHFRTRLTHTMEVAQITRDLARTLGLNEDLAETIALAHDIGHPPFGHTGEDVLNEWMRERGQSFEHNVQSHRRLSLLEQHCAMYPGLNLNREALHGILKHSRTDPETGLPIHHVPEAQLANEADSIAYMAHDTDDGLELGLFQFTDLYDIPLSREAADKIVDRGTQIRGALITLLSRDLIDTSLPRLQSGEQKAITLSTHMRTQYRALYSFLMQRMYRNSVLREKKEHGKKVIRTLCNSYERQPTEEVLHIQRETACSLPEAVKDVVSGMTDETAMRRFKTL